MANLKVYVLIILCCLGACSDSGPSTVIDNEAQTIEGGSPWQDVACTLDIPEGYVATCGTLKRDYFLLPVLVISKKGNQVDSKPLLYLAGGPGGSGSARGEYAEYWFDWYEAAGLDGDLVIVDQRGTGASIPHIDCEAYWRFSRDVLRRDIAMDRELQLGEGVLADCFDEDAGAGKFILGDYGTEHSARDMMALMNALEYPRWNVFGVSYGSRLALALWDMDRGEHIDKIILDSIYPLGRGRLEEWPALLEKAIDRAFQECFDRECDEDIGGERWRQFWQAIASLKQQAMTMSITSWYGEAPQKFVLNDQRFVSLLFNLLYDRYTIEQIPDLLTAVVAGDIERVKGPVSTFVNNAFDPEFNYQVFFAIECQETAAPDIQAYREAVDAFPKLSAYTKTAADYDACSGILNGKAPQPLVHAPYGFPEDAVLLLSGKLDPITPHDYAKAFSAANPGVNWLAFDHIGHSVAGSDPCAHFVIGEFLRNQDPELSLSMCNDSG